MDIKQELLKLMHKHNVTIEQVAQITNIPYKKLQKSFSEDKIKYKDAIKILDALGYKIVFTKVI